MRYAVTPLMSMLLWLLLWGTAPASNYREVARAVNDDQLLQTAGVTPADAQIRYQCTAAIIETDDPPEFFDCVYVQTEKDLNLFSLEDGYLMSELQLKLHNMDGVALQRMGRYSQVQIFSGNEVTALYIHGKSWIDQAQTESVYHWLLNHGVRQRQPRKWIGP
ncbi:MAG TPA: hypothetical protein VFU13_14785 [Steroidobacteraceae bacterium]|nr:hypothetical protein [Steroidobacteraceae bacterium]